MDYCTRSSTLDGCGGVVVATSDFGTGLVVVCYVFVAECRGGILCVDGFANCEYGWVYETCVGFFGDFCGVL